MPTHLNLDGGCKKKYEKPKWHLIKKKQVFLPRNILILTSVEMFLKRKAEES